MLKLRLNNLKLGSQLFTNDNKRRSDAFLECLDGPKLGPVDYLSIYKLSINQSFIQSIYMHVSVWLCSFFVMSILFSTAPMYYCGEVLSSTALPYISLSKCLQIGRISVNQICICEQISFFLPTKTKHTEE